MGRLEDWRRNEFHYTWQDCGRASERLCRVEFSYLLGDGLRLAAWDFLITCVHVLENNWFVVERIPEFRLSRGFDERLIRDLHEVLAGDAHP